MSVTCNRLIIWFPPPLKLTATIYLKYCWSLELTLKTTIVTNPYIHSYSRLGSGTSMKNGNVELKLMDPKWLIIVSYIHLLCYILQAATDKVLGAAKQLITFINKCPSPFHGKFMMKLYLPIYFYVNRKFFKNNYSETCLHWTPNKAKTCINRTLNKVLNVGINVRENRMVNYY